MNHFRITFALWKISTIFTRVLKTRQPRKKILQPMPGPVIALKQGDAIRDASLRLFVASRDEGTSKEEEQQDKENNNPPETLAAGTSNKKKQSSCQFWFCWTPQRWRRQLPDCRINF
jgi:hypothetical protein